MDRINWVFESDEYVEPPYETVYNKKFGMIIEILANPICTFYPTRKNNFFLNYYVEVEVYL